MGRPLSNVTPIPMIEQSFENSCAQCFLDLGGRKCFPTVSDHQCITPQKNKVKNEYFKQSVAMKLLRNACIITTLRSLFLARNFFIFMTLKCVFGWFSIVNASFSWQPVDSRSAQLLLTDYELDSSPSLPIHDRVCRSEVACCLGSLSSGGKIYWKREKCLDRDNNTALLRYIEENQTALDLKLSTMGDVLIQLSNSNRKLIFAGDSVTAQLAEGAMCSWHRISNFFSHSESKHETLWPELFSWVHETVTTNYTINFTERGSVKEAHVELWRTYKPEPNMTSIDAMLNSAQIYVMNWGLHWKHVSDSEDYAITMRNIFIRVAKALNANPHHRIAIWRETSAQHFYLAPGGEYGGGDLKHPDARIMNITDASSMKIFDARSQCGPNEYFPASAPYMWREHVVLEAAKYSKFHVVMMNETSAHNHDDFFIPCHLPVLYYIPFYEMTRQLYSGHHSSNPDGSGGECTHFCSTPFIWEHVYDSIYRAILLDNQRLSRCRS